jgi:formylglycine-generating enzyme required for sulfatase activity
VVKSGVTTVGVAAVVAAIVTLQACGESESNDSGGGGDGGGSGGGGGSRSTGGRGGSNGGGGTNSGAGGEGDGGTSVGGENTGGGAGDLGGVGGGGGRGGSSPGGEGGTPGGEGGAPGGGAGDGGAAGDDSMFGPSCAGLPATCGPSGNRNCCSTTVVDAGTFNRSNDAAFPATVSAFRLDTYEVTVGRFRKFVAGFPGNRPVNGTGRNPNDASDPGWEYATSLPASLPADQAALIATLKCNATFQTWTDTPGTNENIPLNCVDWFQALAFCIWDGGRLPTEAEWNFAAAGGSEQREYPWSNPPPSTTIDGSYAVYEDGLPQLPLLVGSKSPKGDGRWGQADLAGNVWEWTRDWFAAYANPCTNCAALTPGAANRVTRGGAWHDGYTMLLTSTRNQADPRGRTEDLGVRCARSANP